MLVDVITRAHRSARSSAATNGRPRRRRMRSRHAVSQTIAPLAPIMRHPQFGMRDRRGAARPLAGVGPSRNRLGARRIGDRARDEPRVRRGAPRRPQPRVQPGAALARVPDRPARHSLPPFLAYRRATMSTRSPAGRSTSELGSQIASGGAGRQHRADDPRRDPAPLPGRTALIAIRGENGRVPDDPRRRHPRPRRCPSTSRPRCSCSPMISEERARRRGLAVRAA